VRCKTSRKRRVSRARVVDLLLASSLQAYFSARVCQQVSSSRAEPGANQKCLRCVVWGPKHPTIDQIHRELDTNLLIHHHERC
jgi:hypothetical protein